MHNNKTTNGDGEATAKDRAAKSAGRTPWNAPAVRIVGAEDAETGVNSTTDANLTFS